MAVLICLNFSRVDKVFDMYFELVEWNPGNFGVNFLQSIQIYIYLVNQSGKPIYNEQFFSFITIWLSFTNSKTEGQINFRPLYRNDKCNFFVEWLC